MVCHECNLNLFCKFCPNCGQDISKIIEKMCVLDVPLPVFNGIVLIVKKQNDSFPNTFYGEPPQINTGSIVHDNLPGIFGEFFRKLDGKITLREMIKNYGPAMVGKLFVYDRYTFNEGNYTLVQTDEAKYIQNTIEKNLVKVDKLFYQPSSNKYYHTEEEILEQYREEFEVFRMTIEDLFDEANGSFNNSKIWNVKNANFINSMNFFRNFREQFKIISDHFKLTNMDKSKSVQKLLGIHDDSSN